MLLSFALYCGLLLAPLLGVYAPLLIGAALLWPAHDERAAVAATNLDRVMPHWQFRERHSTHVTAPPQAVFDSIRPVTANEILLFRTLTAIRRLGRPLPPNILNPPKDEPLLDIALDVDAHSQSASFSAERIVEPGRLSGLLELGDLVTFEGRHFGLRQRFTAKIVELDRPRSFADEQVRGAFKRLRHVHEFHA